MNPADQIKVNKLRQACLILTSIVGIFCGIQSKRAGCFHFFGGNDGTMVEDIHGNKFSKMEIERVKEFQRGISTSECIRKTTCKI